MNPPDGHDRSGEGWAATVNDPETAEEVREALAIAQAESAALREEVCRLRSDNAHLRAASAEAYRRRRLGAALAEELERLLSPPSGTPAMDRATASALDATASGDVRLRRLLRALRAWRLAAGAGQQP
ncbi:MAG: hypothetical protein NTZ05_11300 [Chloroflexi bacterium]|nr:hypothetical protein [Chloroflexota bacterium]